MNGSTTPPSPLLLAANRLLYERRRQAQAQSQTLARVETGQAEDTAPWAVADSPAPATTAAKIAALPDHLGWGSQALTAVTRRHQQAMGQEDEGTGWRGEGADTAVTPGLSTQESQKASSAEPLPPDWVKLYPDIGLGMLRQEWAAPGRLWLALRYLDREGRGVLRIANIVDALTTSTSPLYLCGKRQLRNLLRDGVGLFWIRDRDRVWLRSAAKVAGGLGVERLTGRPVALPLSALLDGIGTFRAHLYTAFYSGRTKETTDGIQTMPVARDTLAGLSGVGRSSQRAYEARVGVAVQANFAVGETSSKEGKEKRAWQQGQALFEIKDYRGQQGKRGKTYLAWQLPNSYVGQHQRRPKGRQKRINRELKDLVTKGTPGNIGGTGETASPHSTGQLQKRYYPHGKLAAMAYGRHPDQPHYWRWQGTRHGRFVMWQQVGSG